MSTTKAAAKPPHKTNQSGAENWRKEKATVSFKKNKPSADRVKK